MPRPVTAAAPPGATGLGTWKSVFQGKRRSGYSEEARQRIWIWLAAVLLAIIFLASECTNLLPLE